MNGLLVTNAFLRTEKFSEHYDWLRKAAESREMTLSISSNADFFLSFDEMEEAEKIKAYDFILYWDKDIPFGRRLTFYADIFHIPVFNPVSAIDCSDDKLMTYEKIAGWNLGRDVDDKIPLIPTIGAPMTYANIGYTDTGFVKKMIDYLGLPMVIKECRGSFGMQVYLAQTEEEVLAYTKKLEGVPFLYQKYIGESAGKDVRLQVVGGEVVAAMYRYSVSGDFRANLTNGGCMKPYAPSEAECNLAVRATKALGLSFAGVDLLFSGSTDKADLLCEINSNAHFKNIYTCTGINVAECIMEYIVRELSH